jgi:hypothetical protein
MSNAPPIATPVADDASSDTGRGARARCDADDVRVGGLADAVGTAAGPPIGVAAGVTHGVARRVGGVWRIEPLPLETLV